MRLYVFNRFTYTLETIIQAGRKDIPIASVPIRVNGETRPSRLFRSIPDYIRRSVLTIFRIAILYRPLRAFALLAAVIGLPGITSWWAASCGSTSMDGGEGHIQSLAISAALLSIAAILAMGGLIADLIAANRMLLEDMRSRQLGDDAQANRAFVRGTLSIA